MCIIYSDIDQISFVNLRRQRSFICVIIMSDPIDSGAEIVTSLVDVKLEP